jgi:BarA-like signal transduction histidine kinase
MKNPLIDAVCALIDHKFFNKKPLTRKQKHILSNKPILNTARDSLAKVEKEFIFVTYGVWVSNKTELRLEQERLAAHEKRFSSST